MTSELLVFIYLLWFIALFFWIIRRGIELIWKLAALLVFAGQIAYHYPIFPDVWGKIQSNYLKFLFSFSLDLAHSIFNLLPFFWMIIMISVFYMVNELLAERWIKVLFAFSVFIWLVWLVNYLFGDSIAPLLQEELPKFFPPTLNH